LEIHIDARKLTVNYPLQNKPVLDGLDLVVHAGEFVVIAGASGCGKSTLSRTLIGLIPHLTKGTITAGSLEVCGLNTLAHKIYELTQHIGLVFQDPETNIFSLNVLDELAFGTENIGLSYPEIVTRIENASNWVGIRDLWIRRTDQLSGGQKQKVAIAGALAMLPEILVLDEPTTDLDPIGKRLVIDTLKSLKVRLGLTILVIEHDLSNLMDVADRLIVMGPGCQVLCDGAPISILDEYYDVIQQAGIRIPTFAKVGHALHHHQGLKENPFPTTSDQALRLIAQSGSKVQVICTTLGIKQPFQNVNNTLPVIQVSNLAYQYRKKDKPVLRDVTLDFMPSEFVAVVGPNGTGKSTLLKLMIGLLKPNKGQVRIFTREHLPVSHHDISNHVSYVFQNPDHQLFENSVWDEVAFGLRVRKEKEENIKERVTEVLDKVNLLHLKDRHPATLSRGEKRRLAVATTLSHPIDVLLLDEPTTGQDRRTLEGLFEILNRQNKVDGTAVIFVTHDMWTVWNYATRVIGLLDGHVIFDGPTAEILNPSNAELLKQLELTLPLEAILGNLIAEEGVSVDMFSKVNPLTSDI
jgi:energy-coupling factor transport system ATP-binding protein